MLQAPSLVARVADSSIPGSALTEFEQIVRAARLQVLDQLGGADRLAPTKLWQVDALISRWVVKEMLDLDVHRLARSGKLVNLDQRSRRSHPLLADWLKVMAGFEQALAAVGLTRAAAKSLDLAEEARLAVLEETAKDAMRAGTTKAVSPATTDLAARTGHDTTPEPQPATVGQRTRHVGLDRGAPEPPVEVRPATLTPAEPPAIEF